MDNWKAWVFDSSNRPYVLSGFALVFILPLVVLMVYRTTNLRSNAAAADKLEAESGTLGGNATSQTDSQASGGSFVALGVNQANTPTPTSGSTSCTPVNNSGGATAKPTYHSLGLYWSPTGGTSSKTVLVKYRKKGDCTWRNGLAMKYNPISGASTTDYRGSIVSLSPNTDYEVELTLEGTTTTSTVAIKTWTENPPEGTVTTIPNQSTTYSITGSGTANAYRVYDGKGATINVSESTANGIDINASYVIVRNINIKGPGYYGIRITGGKDIIIEDCDISGFGHVDPESDFGFGDNYNSGVFSSSTGTERVTVQRCKIHHPRTDANNWQEKWASTKTDTHPEGPQCLVFFDSSGNHVLRYNECYSDNNHMFNDGFGAGTNGGLVGFPGPDSDIYNNYVSNTWDDGLETEGGGRNLRIWNNYVENAYIPYANASVTVGPFYMWRNVTGMSNGSGASGPGYFLKSGYATSETNMNGQIYLFNNTILQPGNLGAGGFGTAGSTNRHIKHTTTRNNLLNVRPGTSYCISNHASNIDNDFDYDMCNTSYPTAYNGTHKTTGTPSFLNSGGFDFSTMTGDFRLSPSSPGYRKGVIIPNFLEGSGGNPPDVGAQQSNESNIKYGTGSIFTPLY